MITASFVFAIFMLTLGPIKVIPSFFMMTKDFEMKDARALAAKGAFIATLISLAVALIMVGFLTAWKISLDALRIAGGILLFTASMEMITQFAKPKVVAQTDKNTPMNAIAPLAIPTIVTPWGVVAILLFMGLATDRHQSLTILGLLLLIMLLNLVGMLLARPIMKAIGLPIFQIIGWIFAVLQAGLAVEAILISLRHLGIITSLA